MAKRYHDTLIWREDWFLALELKYQFLWFYLKDNCDHAGIWKPNVAIFNKMFGFKIDLKNAIDAFNNGKQRVRVLKNGRWFMEDFIVFQYGPALNDRNRVHLSIISILKENEIDLKSIHGLDEIKRLPPPPTEKEGDEAHRILITSPLLRYITYQKDLAARAFWPGLNYAECARKAVKKAELLTIINHPAAWWEKFMKYEHEAQQAKSSNAAKQRFEETEKRLEAARK